LKHTGEYPIIGVNTFLSSKGSPTIIPGEVIRATEEEKQYQISMLKELHAFKQTEAEKAIREVQLAAINNKNVFETLMEACKHVSLGQLSNALFEVGGQYRRNM
jgi:methylmalonyl-CoA mutase